MTGLCLRVDQVDDGLRLGQIKASVEEGAFGKFPRLSEARPGGDERLEEARHDPDAAMAADLYHILAGVGAWRPHVGAQYLVERGAGAGIDDLAEAHPMRWPAFYRAPVAIPKYRAHNRQRARPADADDSQAAFTDGRCDGRNGVVQRRSHHTVPLARQ